MTDLNELIDRVKAATGPDRELDRAVFLALIAEPIPPEGMTVDWIEEAFPGKGHIMPTLRRSHHLAGTPTDGTGAPVYTASIDAALALVQRVLPDLVIHMTRLGDGSGRFQVTEAWCANTGTEVVHDFDPMDPLPAPLAILTALLQALNSVAEE